MKVYGEKWNEIVQYDVAVKFKLFINCIVSILKKKSDVFFFFIYKPSFYFCYIFN